MISWVGLRKEKLEIGCLFTGDEFESTSCEDHLIESVDNILIELSEFGFS